ncbi:hypothetical protein ACH492_13745 [Streptomyces sp. NPDC019443]|uniref:hypothetical protein n=1 Tax=Streptomyces sp. NPDC019443 TaxID=3365061 RepID=UPI00378F7DC3
MSESPKYAQYEGDPPPCDCTHQTPQGPPCGRTALLLKHALDLQRPAELVRQDIGWLLVLDTKDPLDGGRTPLGSKVSFGSPEDDPSELVLPLR